MLISRLASGTGGEVVGIIKAAKPGGDISSHFYWHQKMAIFHRKSDHLQVFFFFFFFFFEFVNDFLLSSRLKRGKHN